MQPLKSLVWGVCTVTAAFGSLPNASADAKPNPYLTIIDRNPFGLKEPPPPPPPQEEKPAVPPAKVILTGITSLFGPDSKRCFLEVTEQESGKQGTVNRPILREGEKYGSIEVVSIDLEKNLVHIRNGNQETEVKFEDPTKLAGATPRPVMSGTPIPPPALYSPAPPTASTPTIISPASADGSTRNGSVSMFGGQAGAPASMMAANSGAPMAPSFDGNPAMSLGSSPTVVSRNMRTEQSGQSDPLASEKQYLNMVVNAEAKQQSGRPAPPVPPMPDRSIYKGREIPMPPGPAGPPAPR